MYDSQTPYVTPSNGQCSGELARLFLAAARARRLLDDRAGAAEALDRAGIERAHLAWTRTGGAR
jgi:acetyl esterase/lipase